MNATLSCAELLKAAAYAADKHRLGPTRKGKSAAPYINHPIGVAHLLANEAGIHDLAVLQAALLHDVVEDTPTPIGEIADLFGPAVAAIVQEVTDDKSLPKAERKRLQVVNAPGKSAGAACVKVADKICNLREILADPPPWDEDRKRDYFEHAAAVVQRLQGLPPALRALFDAVYARRPRLEVSQAGQIGRGEEQ